jgi:hypothetical protein
MVDVKQKKPEQVCKEQKRQPRKKDPCSGCELDCSTCEVNGTKTLRRVASRTVKRKSTAITNSLAKMAIEGNLNSAKLLISLAGPPAEKAGSKKSRRGRTDAMGFAAEPRWEEAGTKPAETARSENSESSEPGLME